jgi:hypothetical protein
MMSNDQRGIGERLALEMSALALRHLQPDQRTTVLVSLLAAQIAANEDQINLIVVDTLRAHLKLDGPAKPGTIELRFER